MEVKIIKDYSVFDVKISKIEIDAFKSIDGTHFNGLRILTDSNTELYFGIEDQQHCCEEYGYICTKDNIDDFIGAKILYITEVNSGLYPPDDVSASRTVFINIETLKGLLQFTAYNDNGLYGHDVVFHEGFQSNWCI